MNLRRSMGLPPMHGSQNMNHIRLINKLNARYNYVQYLLNRVRGQCNNGRSVWYLRPTITPQRIERRRTDVIHTLNYKMSRKCPRKYFINDFFGTTNNHRGIYYHLPPSLSYF